MISSQWSPNNFTLSESLRGLLDQHSQLNLTNEVVLIDEVSRCCGGYSDVYFGRSLRTGKYVAIKQLRVHIHREEQLSKNISRELRIWSSLNHPNILPLLGYTLRGSAYFSFVCEWMEKGTLREYLKEHPQADIHRMVFGIAAGLQYLHERRVIHSDIKSDNVLISSNDIPMLTDFGVSRVIVASNVTTDTTSVRGSARWMAPELLLPEFEAREPVKANEKTDIWAFGMTIYEILTGKLPFEDLSNDLHVLQAINYYRLPSTPEDLNTRPELDQKLWGLCKSCWEKHPFLRPSIASVLEELCNYPKPPKILIFGEPGVGKSSVVNMISGKEMASISSNTDCCAFETKPYDMNIQRFPFKVYETVGLQEVTLTKSDHVLLNLYRLVLHLRDGVNLLVCIIRGPGIKDSTIFNYKLFRDILCQKKVPVVLIVTGLELEDPMDEWWNKNEGFFSQNEIVLRGHACITATKGLEGDVDKFEQKYRYSTGKVRDLIQRAYLPNAWRMEPTQWFLQVANHLSASKLRLPTSVIKKKLCDALVQIGGCTEEEAQTLANEFEKSADI